MIRSVGIRGLKGREGDLDLDRLNLLLGEVGSGKSAVLDAIRFAALGFVPSVGKTPAATAGLMRGAEMHVDLRLENGGASRGIKRKGRGYTSYASASWLESGATSSDQGEAIRALFGASDLEAAEHLDLRELLAASSNERARRVEALLDATSASVSDILDQVWSRATDKGAHPGFLVEARDALETILLEHGLAAALEHAHDTAVGAASKILQKRAARKEIEDRAIALDVPAATIASLESRREDHWTARAKLRADLERWRAVSKDREAIEAALEALGTLGPRPEDPGEFSPAGFDPKIRLEGARLREESATIEQAAAHPAQAQTEEVPESISIREAEAAVAVAEHALEEVRACPWEKIRRLCDAAIAEPSCTKAVVDVVAEILHVADEHGGPTEEERQNVLDRALEALQTATKARDARETQRARIRERNAAERARYSEEAAAYSSTLNAARDSRRQADEIEALEADRVERLNVLLRGDHKAKREALEAWDRRRHEIANLRARLQGLDAIAPVDTPSAEHELHAHDEALEAIAKTRRACEAADARKRELALLATELEALEAEAKTWRAVESALVELRNEDIGERGGPILRRMRKFLKAAGRTEEPYLRAVRGKVAFGWRRDGNEIPIEALSGGETVIATTALAAAVIVLRGPKVKALLVEAAELGAAEPARAVLAGIEAIASDLDVVLVATCAPIKPPRAWRVHRIEGAA